MDNVLVTGGAGFIGSHTCKELAKTGFCPVVYDDLSHGHRHAVKWGPFEEGSIHDLPRLAAVIAHYQPVAVLHFAAFASVGESVTDPSKYYHNNVVGTHTLLQATKQLPIIFSSTCAVQDPRSPYAHSKAMIEQMIRDYHAAYGLPYAILRYFNAAGADLEGELGEEHTPETHLIPLVLEAALGKRSHIALFGTDYPTPDGTPIRDYIHVTDLAAAHIKALKLLLSGQTSLTLDLGTGTGFSVREVINACERVCNRSIPTQIAPRRAGDPPLLIARPEKSFFTPLYSDLETIISSAYTFYAKRDL